MERLDRCWCCHHKGDITHGVKPKTVDCAAVEKRSGSDDDDDEESRDPDWTESGLHVLRGLDELSISDGSISAAATVG